MTTYRPYPSNPQRRERFLNLAEDHRPDDAAESLPPLVELQIPHEISERGEALPDSEENAA
jgi:hypothetical protein